MTVPLLILLVPTIGSGFWGAPMFGNSFGTFLEGHSVAGGMHLEIAFSSTAIAVAGIFLAWIMYGGGKVQPAAAMSARLRPIHTLLLNRYYMDHLYGWIIGRLVLGVGWFAARFDDLVVDGAVNGVGTAAVAAGVALRRAQSGQLQTYAWVLFAGVVALAALVALPLVIGGRG